MIGPEPHAIFAQRGPRRLIEILHLGGDLRTLQHAQRFDQLKGDAARDPRDVLGLGEAEQRSQQLLDVGLQPQIEPCLHGLARRAGQAIVGNDADARMQRVVGGNQSCDGVAGPADGGVRCQHELIVGCGRQFLGARVDFAGQRLLRGRLQRFGIGTGLGRIGRKCETVEAADHMALYDHFAGLANFRIQHRVFPQAAHQYTGTASGFARSGSIACRYRHRRDRPARPGRRTRRPESCPFASESRTKSSPAPHARRARSCGNPESGRRPTAVPPRPHHAPSRAHRHRVRRDRARVDPPRSARGSAPRGMASMPKTPEARRATKNPASNGAIAVFLRSRSCDSAAR